MEPRGVSYAPTYTRYASVFRFLFLSPSSCLLSSPSSETIGEFWATYEPAQVRKFLHGRTACVRSLSSAAKEWVLAMETEGDRRPTARRLELLRKAAESHIEYARSASEVCVGGPTCSKAMMAALSSPFYDSHSYHMISHTCSIFPRTQ